MTERQCWQLLVAASGGSGSLYECRAKVADRPGGDGRASAPKRPVIGGLKLTATVPRLKPLELIAGLVAKNSLSRRRTQVATIWGKNTPTETLQRHRLSLGSGPAPMVC